MGARRVPIAGGVLGLSLLYALLPFDGNWWIMSGAAGLAAIAGLVPFLARRVRRIQRSHRPVLEAIEAIVLSLTILVVGFAAIYEALAAHGTHFDGIHTKLDAVYFTVTTLGTVGFGDVAATSQPARAIVTAQILFNLAFLGGAFRLVGTVTQRRFQSLAESPDPERRGTM